VNEAYVRLIQWKSVEWQSRAHFFAVAARMMRNILVTHAVHRKRQKRGGDALVVSLDSARASASEPALDIVALDEALKRLAEFDERKSQIVELRFFGGLSEEETAEVLETSLRTIQREWSLARAWLYRELN
jgi:RNA polymerase sigma factor (TIGR02999 family)